MVDSILAQTVPVDEILVVDDGSPDDLATVLAPYGRRVTLLRKANGGAASARNAGIERASGELIAFLDADDYWEPRKLEMQLEILRRHPEVGLVGGRIYQQAPGEPRSPAPFRRDGLFDHVLTPAGAAAFDVGTCISTDTVLVRRQVLGSDRFDEGLRTAEDRDLWVRLVCRTAVYLTSEFLATAVLEPGSLSRSSVDVDYGNMLTVIRRYRGLLGAKALHRWESWIFRNWAASHLTARRPGAALRPAWQRFKRQFYRPEAWWVLFRTFFAACGSAPGADVADTNCRVTSGL
jgi:glycosyltransferase involved in cell wall biosynthesis